MLVNSRDFSTEMPASEGKKCSRYKKTHFRRHESEKRRKMKKGSSVRIGVMRSQEGMKGWKEAKQRQEKNARTCVAGNKAAQGLGPSGLMASWKSKSLTA
jgi:hypothetical protein